MKSCKDITALVSASLDRRLTRWERLQVRLHLLYCSGCSRFEQQMLYLRRFMRARFRDED